MNSPSHPRRKARFLLIPVFVAVVLTVLTLAVHALWNGVLTEVLGAKPVTYWQALGILVLAKILFGGFPGRGGRCGPPWRKHFNAEEWAALPPEKREQMREEMRRRFGSWPRPCWGDREAEPGKSDAASREPDAPKP